MSAACDSVGTTSSCVSRRQFHRVQTRLYRPAGDTLLHHSEGFKEVLVYRIISERLWQLAKAKNQGAQSLRVTVVIERISVAF